MPPPAYSLVTAPTIAPVSVAEAKHHMRVEHDEDDAYIAGLVESARVYIEGSYGLALVSQAYKALLDAWPVGGLKLRPHPVVTLDHVKVWDGTAMTAISAGSVQLLEGRPAFVVLADGVSPPVPSRTRQGIEVQFTCGFGSSEESVPAAIKQAIMLLVSHWYENREATVTQSGVTVSIDLKRGVEDLLAPYRNVRLA